MAARVLVVDDDPVVLRALRRVLQDEEGCEVECASCGEEALARAQEMCPEVVILDLGLPDIHGVDVLRVLKSPAAGPTPKVFILSGQASPQDVSDALDAGADDYWLKPLSPHVLRRGLRG